MIAGRYERPLCLITNCRHDVYMTRVEYYKTTINRPNQLPSTRNVNFFFFAFPFDTGRGDVRWDKKKITVIEIKFFFLIKMNTMRATSQTRLCDITKKNTITGTIITAIINWH